MCHMNTVSVLSLPLVAFPSPSCLGVLSSTICDQPHAIFQDGCLGEEIFLKATRQFICCI